MEGREEGPQESELKAKKGVDGEGRGRTRKGSPERSLESGGSPAESRSSKARSTAPKKAPEPRSSADFDDGGLSVLGSEPEELPDIDSSAITSESQPEGASELHTSSVDLNRTVDDYDGPTTGQVYKWCRKVPRRVMRGLEDLASLGWDRANASEGFVPDVQADVGMMLEEVWEGGLQKGVRVKEVYEGQSAEDTKGLAVGDWLVSLHGVPCSDMSLPEIGNVLHEYDPESLEVDLLMRRRVGAEDDGPDGPGTVYTVQLRREWLPGGDEHTGEQQKFMEDEALDFIRKWEPGGRGRGEERPPFHLEDGESDEHVDGQQSTAPPSLLRGAEQREIIEEEAVRFMKKWQPTT